MHTYMRPEEFEKKHSKEFFAFRKQFLIDMLEYFARSN